MFQVPSFVQHSLFPLSSEQEMALVAEKVIKLTCGNYEFVAKVRLVHLMARYFTVHHNCFRYEYVYSCQYRERMNVNQKAPVSQVMY